MTASDTISVTAIAISIFTFVLSYWHQLRQEILSRKPVLVFVYDDKRGWVVKNVGQGPALNVIVARGTNNEWFCPVRIPPIAKDAEFIPVWLGHVNDRSLGVTYTDSEGTHYTSITTNDLTQVHGGTRFGPWKEAQIGRHWEEKPCRSKN